MPVGWGCSPWLPWHALVPSLRHLMFMMDVTPNVTQHCLLPSHAAAALYCTVLLVTSMQSSVQVGQLFLCSCIWPTNGCLVGSARRRPESNGAVETLAVCSFFMLLSLFRRSLVSRL